MNRSRWADTLFLLCCLAVFLSTCLWAADETRRVAETQEVRR